MKKSDLCGDSTIAKTRHISGRHC